MIVFEIHNLIQEFRDPMFSSHQYFLHAVRLHQHAFCMEPCNFSPLADLAVSVFREVRVKTMIAQYHSSLRL